MSILDWILVTIGCLLFFILFFLLMFVELYCLFKIMCGIDETFYDRQETTQKRYADKAESEDKE